MTTRQRIFVLYTGGTIGMRQSADGLSPDPSLAGTALQSVSDGLEFTWHLCDPLIDSSAVTPADWQHWLDTVRQALPHYDGILILHGTDTLAYTANLFALALSDTGKPIVLTGAQWPYGQEGSDAPHNLACAAAAFSLPAAGVVIAFHHHLYPAVGSSKVSTEQAAAFDNPHFGAYARWDGAHWQILRPYPVQTALPEALRRLNPAADVAVCTLIPGQSLHHTAGLLLGQSRPRAVILQSYGHGNAPSDSVLTDAVRHYTEAGGLLLNISQVPQGCAAAVYAQGSALRQAGAVSGGKCNLETAAVLMTLLAGNHARPADLLTALHGLGLTDSA